MLATRVGIISYAGLTALLHQARRTLGGELPRRFEGFCPVFPVELIVPRDFVGGESESGFALSEAEYHRRLCLERPALYAGDNRLRSFNYEGQYTGRGPIAVDGAWAESFPQYRPFMGERLIVWAIGGGAQAVAVPESVAVRGGGVLRAAETRLGVTERAADFARYARERAEAGEAYDAEAFAEDYLREARLAPVLLTQAELLAPGEAADAETDEPVAEEAPEPPDEAIHPEAPEPPVPAKPSPSPKRGPKADKRPFYAPLSTSRHHKGRR